jgi:hypothetical protein
MMENDGSFSRLFFVCLEAIIKKATGYCQKKWGSVVKTESKSFWVVFILALFASKPSPL